MMRSLTQALGAILIASLALVACGEEADAPPRGEGVGAVGGPGGAGSATALELRPRLRLVGLGYRVEGRPMTHRGAVVANHSSWLDIFVLNACQTVYFVSKSEVSGWFFIGWLARATGTVFIARDPRAAKAQQALFEDRLRAGHKLLFFPEGTSTDGLRVLPFKSTLFAAFYTHGLDHIMQIQPVTVVFRAPVGASPRIYGWWGDMNFGQHLLKILALPRQGSAEVVFHPPLSIEDFPSRKGLALACERIVAARLRASLGEGYAG